MEIEPMNAKIRDALEAAKKALEYSVQCLDGIVPMADEDEAADGGSKTCQACIKINTKAMKAIDAALAQEPRP